MSFVNEKLLRGSILLTSKRWPRPIDLEGQEPYLLVEVIYKVSGEPLHKHSSGIRFLSRKDSTAIFSLGQEQPSIRQKVNPWENPRYWTPKEYVDAPGCKRMCQLPANHAVCVDHRCYCLSVAFSHTDADWNSCRHGTAGCRANCDNHGAGVATCMRLFGSEFGMLLVFQGMCLSIWLCFKLVPI